MEDCRTGLVMNSCMVPARLHGGMEGWRVERTRHCILRAERTQDLTLTAWMEGRDEGTSPVLEVSRKNGGKTSEPGVKDDVKNRRKVS